MHLNMCLSKECFLDWVAQLFPIFSVDFIWIIEIAEVSEGLLMVVSVEVLLILTRARLYWKIQDCILSVPLHWSICTTSVPHLLNSIACMRYAQGWNVKMNYLKLQCDFLFLRYRISADLCGALCIICPCFSHWFLVTSLSVDSGQFWRLYLTGGGNCYVHFTGIVGGCML